MALTTSEIELVDEKNKAQHAENTGYDYSSAVQAVIHEMVGLRVSFPSQPSPLTPSAGKWEYNGSPITITDDDITAYCAAHPQVCVSPSNHSAAVELLQSGGSFAQDPPTTETTEGSSTEPTPDTPSAAAETPSQTSYTPTPTVPPVPSSPTHKVSVKSWLALRDAPSVVKTSNSASKDTELKGNLLDELTNNTELIVIDEGTGYKCEWLEVIVPGKQYKVPGKTNKLSRMFCSSKYVEKVTGKESAPQVCSEKSIPNDLAPVKDWTKQTPNEVYFDEKDAKHKISLEMNYDSTGGAELPLRMEEALLSGLGHILRENGKQADTEYVQALLDKDYFIFGHAEDYYVSTKTGIPLKVLVTLSNKYLEPLPDAPVIEKSTEGAVWGSLEDVKFRAAYDTDKFESTLNTAAKCLEGIAAEIKNFEGTVVDFDANEEAARIRKMKVAVSNLFTDNDITHDPFTKKETLIIGWDETLTPIFASLNMEDGSSLHLAKGLSKFQDTPPVDSQRTQGYVWNIENMNAHCSDLTWTEYITTFTLPTPPEIKPAADDKTGDVSEQEDLAQKESKSMDDKPAKTQTQKEKEDARLFDMELKKMLWLDRKDKRNFVGDAIASPEGLQASIDKIDTVDDAFNVVLNKISVTDLIQIAMSCLVIDPIELELDIDMDLDLFTDINSLLSNPEDIFDLSAVGASAFALPKIPTITLPDELPVTDIMASLANAIKDALLALLNALFVMMIKAVLQALIDICQGSDDGDSSPEANINDMLQDSIPDTPNKLAAAQGLLADLMGAVGPSNGLPSGTQLQDMQHMLNDVSLVLTPYEICTLINGTASLNTLSIVRSLILRMYPNFDFKSRTKLADFFKALGRLIDPSICVALLEQPTSTGAILGDVLCETGDEANQLRKSLLANKGDGITPDQIDELLDKAQKRRADTANALADMLNNGALSDDYEPPPVFCSKGGDTPPSADNPTGPQPQQKKKGLIDLSHDSIDFMAEKVMDTLWAPTYMAFGRDGKDWHKSVVVKATEKVPVPLAVSDGDGGAIANPYLEGKLGKTMLDNMLPEEGPTVADMADVYHLDSEVNKTAPQLKKAYEDFETNDALEFIDVGTGAYQFLFDSLEDSSYNSGFALRLTLPQDATLATVMGQFDTNFDTDDMDLGNYVDEDGVSKPITADKLLELGKSAIPNWVLYYVLPDERLTNMVMVSATMEFPDADIPTDTEMTVEELEELLIASTTIDFVDGDDIDAYIEGEDSIVIVEAAPMETSSLKDDYFIFVTKEEGDTETVAFNIKGEGSYNLNSLSPDAEGVTLDVPASVALNKDTPTQQAVLAEWVTKIWKEQISLDDGNSTAYDDLKSVFESAVQGSLYGEMTRDVMAYVARRAAMSPFFGSITTKTGGSSDVGSPSTAVVSMINLAPERSPECIVNGTDPHLLNVGDMKKQALCDIKDSACIDLDAPTDGSPDTKKSEMENAIMKTVVRTTIRAYIIDQYMRGVFVNSVFAAPEELDDSILEYIANGLKSGLYEYDDLPTPFLKGEYQQDFLTEAVELYKAELEEADETTPEDEDDAGDALDSHDHGNTSEHLENDALKYFIKQEYFDVAAKLKQVFNVSSVANKSIDDVFIQEYLPFYEIASTPDESRFATSTLLSEANLSDDDGDGAVDAAQLREEDFILDEAQAISALNQVIKYYDSDGEEVESTSLNIASTVITSGFEAGEGAGYNVNNLQDYLDFNKIVTDEEQDSFISLGRKGLAEDTGGFFSKELAKPFDSTNGQFYLERYIRVIDHPLEKWRTIVGEDPNGSGGDNSWFHTRGHMDASTDTTKLYDYWQYHGVVNNTTFREMLDAIKNDVESATYLPMDLQGPDGLFAEIKHGIRVMYLPPTDATEFIVAKHDSDYNDWVTAINERRSQFDNFEVNLKDITSTENSTSKKKMIQEKAFKVIERFEGASIEYMTTTTLSDEGVVGEPTKSYRLVNFVREINPFPMASAEIAWETATVSSIAMSASTVILAPSINDITEALKSTDEYKLLTDYIFPLDRYKTLMEIYGAQAISTTGNVAIAFAETKDELYRLFNAVNAKGDYKQHDKALEKIGGNEGLAQAVNNQFGGIQDIPCLDFSLGFDFSFGLKGLGLSFILKMSIEAALIIFKKWVEKFDLNISLAFALSFLSKLVCLNIPTTAFSFGLLPMNVFIGLPGVPLSIQGFIYHALGMGLWKSVDDENSDLGKQLAELGFQPKPLPCPSESSNDCGFVPAGTTPAEVT